MFRQQICGNRECPLRIHEVIDQKNGARWHRTGDAEGTVEVRALVGAVLHRLLSRPFFSDLQHRMEGKPQPFSEATGQIRHQLRVAVTRNARHPARLLASAHGVDHVDQGLDQIIGEPRAPSDPFSI